ncbi:NAD(P)-dependent alcohol dehydrogenase [Lachnospiraceae bacterium LCP19S3_B12]
MKIEAAVVHEVNGPYLIEEVELAAPRADEVLVKVSASGICHTDVGAQKGDFGNIFPIVLGHEGSGVVMEAGSGVKEFKPGDRVAMSFSWCGECPACSTGRSWGCSRLYDLNFAGHDYYGGTPLSRNGERVSCFFGQSSFASHAVVHKNNLVRVPDGMDLRIAAPVGCGIQTGAGSVLNYLRPVPGNGIVVSGCGGVGMSALMAARLCGCDPIVAVDVVDSRLELALELGATRAVNAKRENPVQAVHELTGGRGVEYAVECSGIGECIRTAVNCTGAFGVIAVCGAAYDLRINFHEEVTAMHRTLTGIIEGHSNPKQFIPKLLSFYEKGLFPIDKLIKFYDFKDIEQAVEDSVQGIALKPVLVMGS